MEKSLIFEDKYNYGWPVKALVKKLIKNGITKLNFSLISILGSMLFFVLFI